jgi:segregation and condensation protein B
MSQNLISKVESLLFVSSKPVSIKDLARSLEADETQIKQALDNLKTQKQDSGVVLLESNGKYQLATHAQNSDVVKNYLNAELRERLTDATVEVLGIIAYRQPISKAEVEAIRGVNSQHSLRQLLIRGLVEKIPHPHDARSHLYQTTSEFLQHLGLQSVRDLQEFDKLASELKLPETSNLNEPPTNESDSANETEETTSQS